MNRFEQFLKDQNKKFEKVQVDPNMWNTIEVELIKRKKTKYRYFIQFAASILVIIVFSAIIKYSFFPSNSNEGFTLSDYSNELGLIEKDFKMDIQNKILVLRKCKIPLSIKSNFDFLVEEFYSMDKNYLQSINNIKLHGHNERIENEIIKHYKNKVKILDRIQKEINKIGKIEKENNYENKKVLLHI